MFSNRRYLEVNREERFYCSLLAHALLSSKVFRFRFCTHINSLLSLALDYDHLEVFVEAAILRDYWHATGCLAGDQTDVDTSRQEILASCLRIMGLEPAALDKYTMFRTKTGKIVSPGRWNEGELRRQQLGELLRLRWAFNAKPDLFIVSGSSALMVEAKVESSEGRNGNSGCMQTETQLLITKLVKQLVPPFANLDIRNLLLTAQAPHAVPPGFASILWADVVGLLDSDDIDSFTARGLFQLRKSSPGRGTECVR